MSDRNPHARQPRETEGLDQPVGPPLLRDSHGEHNSQTTGENFPSSALRWLDALGLDRTDLLAGEDDPAGWDRRRF